MTISHLHNIFQVFFGICFFRHQFCRFKVRLCQQLPVARCPPIGPRDFYQAVSQQQHQQEQPPGVGGGNANRPQVRPLKMRLFKICQLGKRDVHWSTNERSIVTGWRGKKRTEHWPGEVPLRSDGNVDEQGAEDKQVCAIVNGVFYQGCFYFPWDGESSWACIRLHEGNQEPERRGTRR